MKLNEKLEVIFTELGERYGSSTTELIYTTPFQLLIAVVLSAQTTDKRVNIVTEELFAKYPDALALSNATPEDVLPIIQKVNYANSKAKYITTTAKMLTVWQAASGKDADQIP